MNEHALTVLEYRETMERVAARAGSELARQALLSLEPTDDLERARRELARLAETLRFLQLRADWAPPVTPDARAPLRILAVEGGVLESGGVLLLARLLEASEALRKALAADPEDELEGGDFPSAFPGLARLRGRLVRQPDLRGRLREVVDDDGEVRDGASSQLRTLRKRLRGARSRVVQALDRYLESLSDRIRVPDASVSIRDGRHVIPIRREGKSEVGGIIHGESASGATLFVEPPVAIRLTNELQELEREEEREIQRILRELSEECRPLRAELEEGLEALVDFETLWARARTARAWEAEVPELTPPDDGETRIVSGRHPLLLETGDDPVVPFDLVLEPHERALVVSGPNTGGKTVLLKALGLVHLLSQSGVAPPVGPGTRLPLVRDVFADIGDEQSIVQSLSTFSAHLANAIEILEGARAGTLVLMDEMGTGTDPAEGAALSRAILETLVEKGARAVVTSHLGALKRLDREGSGIVNASLLFDPERIAPTYRLRKGRPGRSYGLAIARRLGVPEPVLQRAEEYVDSGELEVESLLATLEEKERRLSVALEEARVARARAEELEKEAETREARLTERERKAEARAREEARQLLLEAREEVEEAIRGLQTAGEGDREAATHEARRRVEEAARRQREEAPALPERRPTGTGAAVSPGARVRVRGSGASGRVREVRDDRVTVEVGGLRLEVPAGEVEPVEGDGSDASSDDGSSEGPRRGGGWTGPDLEASSEADLRGLRVDEVELELARSLDAAVLSGLSRLRVIHGKGTGAVKGRVRELLQEDSRVTEFRDGRPGEGGTGVTVVELG